MSRLGRPWIAGLLALALGLLAPGALADESTASADVPLCRHHVAWPDGLYLGQLHPALVDAYVAQHRQVDGGEDPCSIWANAHRASAIQGLRAMGYTVLEPEPRISWTIWWGHGLWASITDADGDRMTLVSAGGAAGVPATPATSRAPR